ncbi:cupredoxin domain-containing protein [Candidatus Daviesbacteria bacterium]|nr:cupredoxin domain-containing protein [Candidatus Daviesbacteria bacterium]
MDNNGYGKRPLWQWVIIYLLIGGIIYAGIYYFFLAKKGGYNQPTPSATDSASPKGAQTQNTVTLTSNGFSPATLTIKTGETVSWVNKSGQEAAINSNPHPVHISHTPLNLGNFPDEGSLTLTFDKQGTFGYHNHLNPSELGTINVE